MRIAPIAAALALTFTTPAFAQDSYDADTVLAEVGDTKITLGHLIALRGRLTPDIQAMGDAELYQGLLAQLIDRAVIAEGAAPGGKRAQLAADIDAITFAATSVLSELQGQPVDEAALQAAYDSQIAEAPDQVQWNASHILVESEEEAKALIESLSGGADFAELAKEKSTGPSGPNGGELGWFGAGQMVPAFEAAVTSLETGEVSAPVQTRFGWHVVKLNDTQTTPKPTFEEARAQLEPQLREAQAAAAIEAMRSAVEVTRMQVSIPPAAIREDALIAGE